MTSRGEGDCCGIGSGQPRGMLHAVKYDGSGGTSAVINRCDQAIKRCGQAISRCGQAIMMG